MSQYTTRGQSRRGSGDSPTILFITIALIFLLVLGLLVNLSYSKGQNSLPLFPVPIRDFCAGNFNPSTKPLELADFRMGVPFEIIGKGETDGKKFAEVEQVGGALFYTFEPAIVQHECGKIFYLNEGSTDNDPVVNIATPGLLQNFQHYRDAFGITHNYDSLK